MDTVGDHISRSNLVARFSDALADAYVTLTDFKPHPPATNRPANLPSFSARFGEKLRRMFTVDIVSINCILFAVTFGKGEFSKSFTYVDAIEEILKLRTLIEL
ncbi:hypothetical protein Tco_1195037 [Tanacetum coccineum]